MQSNENDLVNMAKVSFKEGYKLKYTCSPLCSENSPGRLIHKDVNLAMTDSRSKRETPNPCILFLSVLITIARLIQITKYVKETLCRSKSRRTHAINISIKSIKVYPD